MHFSTLRGGAEDAYSQYNLCDYTGDAPNHVSDCRKQFATALGISVERLWFPRQVHGTTVVRVDGSTPQGVEADAVITNEKGLCIGVSTADCVPLLIADRKGRGIAAIHAGWRGTVEHIAGRAVEALIDLTGGTADELVAMIGPSISPEAFEVGEEVAEAFRAAGRTDCVLGGYRKPHVDLRQANVMDLLDAGLDLLHVDCTPACSWSSPQHLFSARRLGIQSGRTASCIMMQ